MIVIMLYCYCVEIIKEKISLVESLIDNFLFINQKKINVIETKI